MIFKQPNNEQNQNNLNFQDEKPAGGLNFGSLGGFGIKETSTKPALGTGNAAAQLETSSAGTSSQLSSGMSSSQLQSMLVTGSLTGLGNACCLLFIIYYK